MRFFNSPNLSSIFFILFLVTFFIDTNVSAKDISSEITVAESGAILGCLTRFEIYASNSKNIFPNEDPNFTKKMVAGSLKISVPYIENIKNAAWEKYPIKNWDAFYAQQVGEVKDSYQTNNVFFDTMNCVQDLLLYGAMYPKEGRVISEGTGEMPPEQQKIMMEMMGIK